MPHTRIRFSAPTEELRLEHRRIRELLHEFSAVPRDDRDRRELLLDWIHRRLLLHLILEEEVIYPALRKIGAEQALGPVDEAEWSHGLLRQLLTELSQMSAQDRSFDTRMSVLRINVEHYIDAEERLLFPLVRALSP